MIRRARSDDLPQIARVFWYAFPQSVSHVFGKLPVTNHRILRGLTLIFEVLLSSDPCGLFVAEVEGHLCGYVFSPTDIRRIWKAFFTKGYLWRFFGLLFRGHFPLSLRALGIIIHDKMAFFRSATKAHRVYARILSIAVLPDFQGQGLGKQLLQTALEYLQEEGVNRVRLEVRADNPSALCLYEQVGFEVVDSTCDSQGMWLIMCKDLRSAK